MSFLELFTDPLSRGPLIATLFMSISTALVGAIAFIRKKSLVAETLSHATFPGVAFGLLASSFFFSGNDLILFYLPLLFAFGFAILAQALVEKMLKEKKSADVSLCYILSFLLAIGVLVASYMQHSHVMLFKKLQIFFYGQAATMHDTHIYIYGALSLLVALVALIFQRAIKFSCFDPLFSSSVGIKSWMMKGTFSFLLTLSIVIGIRSVGVVLVTGMMIAPSVVARAFTKKFFTFLLSSSLFGALFAFLGYIVCYLLENGAQSTYSVPIGPAIIVISSLVAFVSLLFAPSNGAIIKLMRKWRFQKSCILENILKFFWKMPCQSYHLIHLKKKQFASFSILLFALFKLVKEGYLKKEGLFEYRLTEDGKKKAAYIVRLHRLWELYLIEYLSSEVEKVHQSAELIEHIITPEIEDKLTKLLLNPKVDPHMQPIPIKEVL
jgi:manganese/zinc/iron transport system permease protein